MFLPYGGYYFLWEKCVETFLSKTDIKWKGLKLEPAPELHVSRRKFCFWMLADLKTTRVCMNSAFVAGVAL